jgi:hypothetical protein
MDRFRSFALPGYLILATMIVFPLLDAVLTVWPLRLSEVSWRFGAVGMFSRAVMTPLFGVILVYGLALIYDHRMVQRAVAIVAAISALALLGVSFAFVLDAVQMRGQVQPHMKTPFDVASVVALGKLLVISLISVLLFFAAFRSSGGVRGRSRERVAAGGRLVTRETAART